MLIGVVQHRSINFLCWRLLFQEVIMLHKLYAQNGTQRTAHYQAASAMRWKLTARQRPAATGDGAHLEDDSTDNEEAGGDERAAPIAAAKRPRRLTHRATQGCFCCRVTSANKFYHCTGVAFAAALVGAGPDDVVCQGCYDDRRPNRFPAIPHYVRHQ